MSIWNGLKSAFGFGGTGYEEGEFDSDIPAYTPKPIQPDYHSTRHLQADAAESAEAQTRTEETAAEGESASVSEEASASATPESAGDDTAATATADPTPDTVSDPQLPADLFDAIIERFNSFQPDFVARCLNVEAERKYLLESLDKSLRSRVAAAAPDTAAEMESLRKRVATLEAQTRTNDELRQENRRLRLSVERQKRSLLDRINDLESQVARHYQEKESFFASRHTSLCAITPGHNSENTAAENQAAKEAPAEQPESPATTASADIATPSAATDAAAQAELEQLRAQLAEANAREAELTAQLKAQEEETARQSTLREQLEVKTAMSDQMLNSLRNELAANLQEYEETYTSQQQALELIQEQVESFEQIKERMEARVAELKEALKKEKALNQELAGAPSVAEENARLIEETSRLNSENSSLRHTIETNLYNQANSEMKLRAEIKELTSRIAEMQAAASAAETAKNTDTDPILSDASFSATINAAAADAEERPAPKRRRGRPKKVKIDDELDNTEWFAAQKESADFGYHEPPRRPSNDDANQLSLF